MCLVDFQYVPRHARSFSCIGVSEVHAEVLDRPAGDGFGRVIPMV